MKRYVYVDNYRGFPNTLIDFAQVNFFLGENSTGKTSILNAIKLMSDVNFWFSEDFNIGGANLGNFNDLVSVESSDRSYFFLGFCQENSDQHTIFRLVKFENREGFPYATRTIIYEDKNVFHGVRKGKSIFYKFLKRDDKSCVDVFFESIKFRNDEILDLKESKIGNTIRNFPLLMYSCTAISNSTKEKHDLNFKYGLLSFANNPVWLAPIRTKTRRTYDEPISNFTSDGKHTPFLIRKQLSNKEEASKFKKVLTDIGKKGNLFKDVSIKTFSDDPSAPFQVQIILNKKPLSIHNVGYGVCQSLPVIVELLSHPKGDSFIIQQPEVHLHPKAQAAIGELIHLIAREQKTLFFIETHSDYLIDRFRINLRDQSQKIDAQVLFFNRNDKGNCVHHIEIGNDGEYSGNKPKEFREFFISEELAKLGV